MSENEKNNKNFEFIKEQVIEKKRKKLKKRLIPLLMTITLAILFGIIASVTFVLAEPKFYSLLHKEKETKASVSFPTIYPEDTANAEENNNQETETGSTTDTEDNSNDVQDTVIVEQSIDADMDDYISMYEDIKEISYKVNKSLVDVSSTITEVDWFNESVDRTINTTGVVVANINEHLLILVSLDRVKDASSIKIKFSDNTTAEAVLQDYETEVNLAIISVAIKDIPALCMNNIEPATLGESYTITAGSPVLALGSPNGHSNSVGLGIISSCNSMIYITDNELDLFNTDMEDNENSDGIIVNMKGEVIGVITRTLKDDISKGLSTAIGISKVKPIIERLANKEPRIYFGVKAEDMTEDAIKENQITNGIYVNEVQADSPAFDAGINNGDIILEVNGQPILNTNFFNNAISEYQPGEKVTVKIKRTMGKNKKEASLTVILEEKVQ